jgi:hypothetical protein
MDDYPKSKGVLFDNRDRKKEEKHPDYAGHVVVTKEQINKLVEQGKAGEEPKINIGGWLGSSKGTNYLSLKTDVGPEQKGGGQKRAPAPPPPAPPPPASAGWKEDDLPF